MISHKNEVKMKLKFYMIGIRPTKSMPKTCNRNGNVKIDECNMLKNK